MKKTELQEIKTYLDAIKPSGKVADYNRAIDWFWQNYPPPAHRPTANNHVFDRFCFQAFERLGLNQVNELQDRSNRRIINELRRDSYYA